MKTAIKQLWILTGTLFLVIGVIGLLLPIIPTTPFILLSAFCYAKGSEKLHRWLINNRLFGLYIKNYEEGKGIPTKIKIYAITILWVSIITTTIIFLKNSQFRTILIILALFVTVYIILIKPKSTS